MKYKHFTIECILFAVGIPIGFVSVISIGAIAYGAYIRYYDCATEYTKQYKQSKFDSIQKEMSASEVTGLMGAPFYKQVSPEDRCEDWFYSQSKGKSHHEAVFVHIRTQDWRVVRTYRFYQD